MKVNFKRYFLYLLRWQLSTPILAGVLLLMSGFDPLTATITANLIGGLLFFWVDGFIFTSRVLSSQWEVRENIACSDCGKTARGYRLVKTKNYDRTNDISPKFRCELCSRKKSDELRQKGVEIE